MFKVILNGEMVETIMYDDFSDALYYAREKYGNFVKVVKIGD